MHVALSSWSLNVGVAVVLLRISLWSLPQPSSSSSSSSCSSTSLLHPKLHQYPDNFAVNLPHLTLLANSPKLPSNFCHAAATQSTNAHTTLLLPLPLNSIRTNPPPPRSVTLISTFKIWLRHNSKPAHHLPPRQSTLLAPCQTSVLNLS